MFCETELTKITEKLATIDTLTMAEKIRAQAVLSCTLRALENIAPAQTSEPPAIPTV